MIFDEYRKTLLNYEKNSNLIKRHQQFKFALVYPNRYSVGMSNLGFLNIYKIINDQKNWSCERCFLYDNPFEAEVKTLESGSRISDFDIIGFSLNFELDVFNIIKILKNSDIPILRKERKGQYPVLIAGGNQIPINPSPIMQIFDALFVGESEEIIFKFLNIYSENNTGEPLIHKLSDIQGLLFPKAETDRNFIPVARAYVKNIEELKYYPPLVTAKSHISEAYLIEVGRGCGRRCSFCAAHSIYKPVRFLNLKYIKNIIDSYCNNVNKIGLVGAAISDYPYLDELTKYLAENGFQIGLSSFRPDKINKNLIRYLSKSGVNSITIAPETGNENLRFKINKKIYDESIYESVKILGDSKINNLKLYFLTGIPGEKDKHIDDIINMTRKIHQIFITDSSKNKSIRLSINTLIPKPFTPFQFATLNNIRNSDKKRKYILNKLKHLKNLDAAVKSKRQELIQAVLSQGTEKIVNPLVESEGEYSLFMKLIKKSNQYTYINRTKTAKTSFPWDIIDNYVGKKDLWEKYKKIKG